MSDSYQPGTMPMPQHRYILAVHTLWDAMPSPSFDAAYERLGATQRKAVHRCFAEDGFVTIVERSDNSLQIITTPTPGASP